MKFKKILTGFVAALMLSGAIGAPVTAKATTHYGGWRTSKNSSSGSGELKRALHHNN